MATRLGHRTILSVPLLREKEAIGFLTVRRNEVRPFTPKQIELVTTFADQAVIAIENVRLFEEVQTRTRELAQSVGELRALGEVTQAVNSTVDLETVLTTIVAKATELSGTEAGAIYVFDDAEQEFRLRATYGLDDAIVAELKDHHFRLGETAISEAAERRVPIQIPDVQTDPSLTVGINRARWVPRSAFRPADRRRPDRRHTRCQTQATRRICQGNDRTIANLRRAISAGHPECEAVRKCGDAHARTGEISGRTAHDSGPSGADGKTCLAGSTDSRHCSRDQKPAQFRQQLFGRLGRAH